jgi:signal transduction histidine kinase
MMAVRRSGVIGKIADCDQDIPPICRFVICPHPPRAVTSFAASVSTQGRDAVSEAHISTSSARLAGSKARGLDREVVVRVGAWAALAIAYFGAAKLGQALRYTGSVSAIWPPVGLGMAALYLWGLRLWPGIFVGELLVNVQLLLEKTSLPVGSVAGQQLGNMAEVLVGAWLLLRLIGPRAKLDSAAQIGKLIVAIGTATTISATVGTLSMLAGDVIESSAVPNFWRTWWLGDSSGALVVLPLMLVWVGDAKTAWRRMLCPEGALMIATVVALAVLAVTSEAPLTYLIFPALIWAAFRFGAPGVTLATTINAGITIGVTADRLGPFFKQPIDDRTLSTQLYVLITAVTALFLSAVVSERQRSVTELVAARRRESDRALSERRRIARELHDSVSQALFSSGLHTRTAQRALDQTVDNATVRQHLDAIDELTKRAQREMRSFIFDWGPGGIEDGLVTAFSRHAASLASDCGLAVSVVGPESPLPLPSSKQSQLYAIGREALANVAKHSGANTARVHIEADVRLVTLEVRDAGKGFAPAGTSLGHQGIESMRSRVAEIEGELVIASTVGRGTVVTVTVPVDEGA